jgi:hypothetical protein
VRTTPEDKKQQVIAGLVDARSKILASVAALPPAQQDVVFLGEWSVKDLLAHLIGWDFANLEATKEVLAGKLPSFYAHHDHDWRTYNARLVAEHKREDFAALLEAVEDSHRQLEEYLRTVPAEEFGKDRGLRFRGWRVTITALLKAETSDERKHHEQIEEFRRRAAADR